MDFTELHQEIAGNAYLLGLEGKGQVLEAHAYPAAHELAEAGWLERRFEPNGDMSWWWTAQGDVALELGALTTGHSAN
jgi:hypothetical protein